MIGVDSNPRYRIMRDIVVSNSRKSARDGIEVRVRTGLDSKQIDDLIKHLSKETILTNITSD